jgi:soluble lytic murein transglycosylase-like protein
MNIGGLLKYKVISSILSVGMIGNVYGEIALDKIRKIESNDNPKAYNRYSQARGLYQITPICLKEYNNFHDIKYSLEELYNPEINTRIAEWYLQVRIPQMLKHYHKPDTDENRIIAYNAGIMWVVNGKPLPKETKEYIRKYNQ